MAKKACFILQSDMFRPLPGLRAIKEARKLRSDGWQVSAVCWIRDPSLKYPEKETIEGIDVHRLFHSIASMGGIRGLAKRARTYLYVNKKLAKMVADTSPDLIVAHDLEVLRAGVLAKKRVRCSLIYDSHEDYPAMVSENSRMEAFIFSMIERRLLKKVDHVFTVGEHIAKKFLKYGSTCEVLYNAQTIDAISKYNPVNAKEIRRQLGYSDDDFVIGFVGRIRTLTGLEQLISSLTRTKDSVKLLVVGDGPLEDECKRLAKESNILDSRVRFIGRVPYEQVLDYHGVVDAGAILLQPTPNHLGAMPNKLFDFMGVGTPLLVSDFPGMRGVVSDARCGICVDPTKPEEIAKAIGRLTENIKTGKGYGPNGKSAFMQKYAWDNSERLFMMKADDLVKA
jgi:glycosyltransferase involved in cell wall biosynthesis